MGRIGLSGVWTMVHSGIEEASVPCPIPGDGHSALLAAGRIGDPYYGTNELDIQDLGRGTFSFEREFVLSPTDGESGSPYLHLESVDTVAEISVNGILVGRSSNMFRAFRADLRGIVRQGVNRIRVDCLSAEAEAAARASRLAYPVPHSEYPVQSRHRNLVRKVQCHGGWDWGPCIMAAGIYGDCYIDFSAPGRIENLAARTLRGAGGEWRVPVVTTYLVPEGTDAPPVDLRLILRDASGRIAAERSLAGISLKQGENRLEAELVVESPELWWPAGYGSQSLYTLEARIEAGPSAGGPAQTAVKRLGFRELRVVAEEDPRGRSLTFRVNGRDVWAKGANWIPADALPAAQTPRRYRELLGDMAAANMNMVRVWGGGQYERDIFYDTCDELGILVWQDMMFACSMYPADAAFLEDVRGEVAYQVARLKEHPCIALWCGNNENVGALTWYPETRAFRDRYIIDYDRLNEGAVGAAVRAGDPDRTWWPSSPSAGPADFSDCWHSDGRGDMHYWSVWHEGKPFEAYYDVTPRFCSEFGYQSFPSLEGVASYCPQDQRNLTSPVMEHHQKNPRGNSIILENFSRYFRFPEGFENMLYLSQVQQALAIKTAVEYWRSRRPECMGALYWQLNDCWPVASWSSIEHSGKWKLLHYAAKRFFAPVSVAAFRRGNDLTVGILNDRPYPLEGTLILRAVDFGGTVLRAWTVEAQVPAERPAVLWSDDAARLAAEEGIRADGAFLQAEFRSSAGDSAAAELFLTEPKRCGLRDPGLDADLSVERGRLAVTLRAERPCFYAAVDIPGLRGYWEDNMITLLPGTARTLRFIPRDDFVLPDEAVLRANMTVRHLRGTYS